MKQINRRWHFGRTWAGEGGEGLKRFFDSQAITAFCLTIAQRATLRENGLVWQPLRVESKDVIVAFGYGCSAKVKLDFELSRVKLQRKVPEGEQKSLWVHGVRVTDVKITINTWGTSKRNPFCFEGSGYQVLTVITGRICSLVADTVEIIVEHAIIGLSRSPSAKNKLAQLFRQTTGLFPDLFTLYHHHRKFSKVIH